MGEEEGGSGEGLRGERDGLAAWLEYRDSIKHMTRLLFGLMRERLWEVARGVAGKGGPGRARDRMLQAGAGTAMSIGEGGSGCMLEGGARRRRQR